jgi:hypothetical protein
LSFCLTPRGSLLNCHKKKNFRVSEYKKALGEKRLFGRPY